MTQKSGKMLKIILFTGYRCNNFCRFCVDSNKREFPEKSTEQLIREIYSAKTKGADILEIIGGEATIRPDFPLLVKTASDLGIGSIAAATNGRVFADFSFADKIVSSGITSLIFSVHGSGPKTHDLLTGSPGSFSELERGMENLRRLGFNSINGNTTVVRPNLSDLGAIAAFYVKRGIRNVEYIFVDPNSGGAFDNFKELVPRISEAAPHMRRALDLGRAAGFAHWHVRYVPVCHFRGYEEQISEINEREFFFTEHWAPDFRNTDAIESRQALARKKTGRCRGCAFYMSCEGLWTEYLKHYGDGEVRKIRKA